MSLSEHFYSNTQTVLDRSIHKNASLYTEVAYRNYTVTREQSIVQSQSKNVLCYRVSQSRYRNPITVNRIEIRTDLFRLLGNMLEKGIQEMLP